MGELIATPVSVRSPATSANLGPGFDAFGLALGLYDTVRAVAVEHGVTVDIDGEGSDAVGRDESHLVVRAARAAFDALGVQQPGLHLSCVNRIPHGRGLGSSAAAIVTGIRLADGLLGGAALSADQALELATAIEGHPDNVAACLLGGFAVAWRDEGRTPHAVRLDVHPTIRPVVFIAPGQQSTASARAVLPSVVPHRTAGDNAARAALLVAALTTSPRHLLPATADELHQPYRRAAMPESLALVDDLRLAGVPAVLSGAGPSILALGTDDEPVDVDRWTPRGWIGTDLPVSREGASVQSAPAVRE
jgi:homoserine kinase